MKQLTLSIVLSLFLISCGVTKRDFDINTNVEVTKEYLTENLADEAFENAAITTEWWTQFNDPVLDSLIEKSRKHNLDINAAVANLYASRATLKGTKFDKER